MIEKHLNNYVKRILQFQCPFTLKMTDTIDFWKIYVKGHWNCKIRLT
jgi:hypothetical protein